MQMVKRLLMVLFVSSVTAGAVVRHVDVAVAGGSGNGSSWENAYSNLQSALQAARSGDEVWIAAGVYFPDVGPGRVPDSASSRFEIPAGVAVFGGFSGNETSLTQRDPLVYRTVLSGDLQQDDHDPDGDGITARAEDLRGVNATVVVSMSGFSTGGRLDGLVITGGDGNSQGGGLTVTRTDVVVARCEFRGNRASTGGGISMTANGGFLVNCVISGNRATLDGGGLRINGTNTISGCVFLANSAARMGGGLLLENSGHFIIGNCTFTANRAAQHGGAIRGVMGSRTQVLIQNSILWNNEAFGVTDTSSSSYYAAQSGGTPADFRNSIVANSGGSGSWLLPLTRDLGGNLDTDPSFVQAPAIGAIPTLGPEGLRLNPGSPAINAGSLALLAADRADLDHDQNTFEPQPFEVGGGARVLNGAIDMGAHEGVKGPAVVGGAPRIELEPGSGLHPGIVDFSDIFDETAVSFAVASMTPAGRITAVLDPVTGMLDLTVLPGAVGEVRLMVAASDASGGVSHVSLSISIFPPVLFVDAAATGAGTGLSWVDAIPHLQDALALGGSNHEIWIAAGVQRPDLGSGVAPGNADARFVVPAGVSLRGGFASGQTDPAQRAAGARTILSADVDENDIDADGDGLVDSIAGVAGANAKLLLEITGAPLGSVLDHFVVNGAAGTTTGGGLRIRNSALTVRRCDFIANQATQGAGAHVQSDKEIHFEECTFQHNLALQSGGGVRVVGNSVVFTGCHFEVNESRSGGGGLAATDGSLKLFGCEFVGNQLTTTSDQGGALRVQGMAVLARDCYFIGNAAVSTFGYGGAIYGISSNIDLLRCGFESNAAYDGGALFLDGGTVTRLVQAEFGGNSSGSDGGAIYLDEAELWVAASEFIGNTSAGDGGAVYNYGATPEFHGCTFSGNDAVSGGGGAIYNRTWTSATPAAPLLTNCIIWNNRSWGATHTARASVGDVSTGHESRFAHCLIANSGGSAAWNAELGHDLGGNLDVDPRFLIPVEIGGTTGDPRLLLTSPAVGAGDVARVPADVLDADGDLDVVEPLPQDLSGNPRVAGAAPDLGAHEAEPGPALVGTLPLRRLEPLSGSHAGLFEAAGFFDASAVSFRIERIVPEGILTASIDPAGGRVDVEVVPHQFGPVQVIVGATNAAGHTSYQVGRIDVFPSVVFVDPSAAGLATGLRWQDAFPNLQSALGIPRIVGIPVEIWVAKGVHRPDEGDPNASFLIPGDTHLFGGFAGNEVTRGERDPLAHPAVLSGDLAGDDVDPDGDGEIADPVDRRGTNALRVVTVATPEPVTLDGFTITGAAGGGVLATAAELKVNQCRFVGNQGGGGGAMRLTGGWVVVESSVFERNLCGSNSSSSIFNGGAIYASDCQLELSGGAFIENRVGNAIQPRGDGGGIAAFRGSLVVVGTRFERNDGVDGGGAIWASDLALRIEGCDFLENKALGSSFGNGGAVEITNCPTVLCKSTFTGNRATNSGGAVHLSNGTLDFFAANVDFRGNSAYSGGAMSISGFGQVSFANAVFSGNLATFDGGGVTSSNRNGIFSHCTFSGNRAHRRGGAFYFPFVSGPDAPAFRNSIFWNNFAGGESLAPIATIATQSDYNQLPNVFSHCLVHGSGGSAAWNAGFGIDGGGNIDGDPAMLIPFSPLDAPGAGGDFRLSAGSVAIHAGLSTHLPQDFCDLDGDGVTLEPLPQDRGGAPRVISSLPDLGAYEAGAGPGAAGPPPRLELDPDSGSMPAVFSVATVFNGASGFGIDTVMPAGVLDVGVDPLTGLLDVDVPPGTVGRIVVILRGTSASGAVSHRPLVIDVFPDVIFVDRAATGAGSGLNWADAFPHLQDALALGGSGYSIWVAAGIYRPDEGGGQVKGQGSSFFRLTDGVGLYGGFEAGATTFAERDPERWRTVLSGDLAGDDLDPDGDGVIATVADQRGGNSPTVVLASGAGGETVMDGVWITAAGTGALITEGPGLGSVGGGILVSGANPVIRNCRFHGNTSTSGGAMALLDSGPLVVERCHFAGNEASQNGGAVFIKAAEVEFRGCEFRENRSVWGGALSGTSGHLTLAASICSGNVAERGGAVYFAGEGAVLVNSLLHGNQAGVGGAIENAADVLHATHCTFTENTAWDHGGAVSNSNFPSENEAIYTNCILWNNQRGLRSDSVSASSSTYNGAVPDTLFVHCLIANSGGSTAWDPAAGVDGGGNIDADPGFIANGTPGVPLADGSGFQPRTGSPVIDAGATAAISSDLFGNPRPQGTAPDLGCFESDPAGPAVIERRRVIRLAPGSGAHPASVSGMFDSTVETFGIASVNPPEILVPTIDTVSGGISLQLSPDRFGRVQVGIEALDAGGGRSIATLVVDVVPERVYVNHAANGSGSGLNWADAFPSLHQALDQAVAGYDVWVAEGEYYPFLGPGIRYDCDEASFKLRAGVSLLGGFAGTESELTARDPKRHPTVLKGYRAQAHDPRPDHLVTVVGAGTDCVLDGFTLSGARAGAIHIDDSSPIISQCRITDNYAQYSGGAGAWIGAGSSPRFLRCEFLRCHANDSRGGAVFAASGSTPVFESCIWQNNSAWQGGAIAVAAGAEASLINVTISGNAAHHDGGGLWNAGEIFLGNSIVWNNLSGTGTVPVTSSVPSSSMFNASGSTARHQHNLLANSGGSPAWNAAFGLDLGGNLDANPVFLSPANPSNLSSGSGDLRPGFGSAALDIGADGLVSSTTDFEGHPRIVNAAVDLGAYEGQNEQLDSDGDGLSDAFELEFTTPPSRTMLAAGGDDDGDGLLNRDEYFFGLDPLRADAHEATSLVHETYLNQTYLAIQYSVNPWAGSLRQAEVERSSDLGGNDGWSSGETTRVRVERLMPDLDRVTERSKQAIGSSESEFLRVRVGPAP
jgi:hypothetical protein